VLKLHDWEVLDLAEEEFRDWKTADKVDNIKGWLQEAKNK